MRRARTKFTLGVTVGLAMKITKEMLGIEMRKKILYLDQSFFSLASKERRHAWVDDAIARITELLDLQLLATPYWVFLTKTAKSQFWV